MAMFLNVLTGGLGPVQLADEYIQTIVDNLSLQLGVYTCLRNKLQLKAISYRSQIVAGTNLFIKVFIGDNRYVHLKVFEPLPYTGEQPKLENVKCCRSIEDVIDYF